MCVSRRHCALRADTSCRACAHLRLRHRQSENTAAVENAGGTVFCLRYRREGRCQAEESEGTNKKLPQNRQDLVPMPLSRQAADEVPGGQDLVRRIGRGIQGGQ